MVNSLILNLVTAISHILDHNSDKVISNAKLPSVCLWADVVNHITLIALFIKCCTLNDFDLSGIEVGCMTTDKSINSPTVIKRTLNMELIKRSNASRQAHPRIQKHVQG